MNPTQFAQHEDLARYPRTLSADLDLLRGHADLVLAPADAAELYPSAGAAPAATVVDPGPAFGVLGGGEAASRPHFFQGVATVCTKLFNVASCSVVVRARTRVCGFLNFVLCLSP